MLTCRICKRVFISTAIERIVDGAHDHCYRKEQADA